MEVEVENEVNVEEIVKEEEEMVVEVDEEDRKWRWR